MSVFVDEKQKILKKSALAGIDEHPLDTSVALLGHPGSGKTTQTRSRIKHLCDEYGYRMSDVCMATFRRSMSREFLMSLADADMIPFEAAINPKNFSETAHISTMHAVCLSLSPYSQEYTIDGNGNAKQHFCEEVYGGDVPYSYENASPRQKPLGRIAFDARDYILENRLTFDDAWRYPDFDRLVDRLTTSDVTGWLERFHRAWELYKEDEDIVEFIDMLLDAAENERVPGTAIVALDEYHDFTPIQHEIAQNWIESAEVAIVNYDHLQTLYTYAGARPEYPQSLDLPVIELGRSFRVPRNIWRYATAALEPAHTAPTVIPRDEDGHVICLESANIESEMNDGRGSPSGVSPLQLYEKYGTGDQSMMYLTRTKGQAKHIATLLKREGIIYASQSGVGGWNTSSSRRGVYNVLAGLSQCQLPEDARIPGQALLDAAEWGDERKPPHEIEFLGNDVANFFEQLSAEYIEGKKSSKVTVYNDKAGHKFTAADLVADLNGEGWHRLTEGPSSTGCLMPSYRNRDIIRKALIRYGGEQIRGNYNVTVRTIHAAKGSEADTVVLYEGLTNRIRSAMRNERVEQSEARVWYVACTRARKHLVVMQGGWNWIKQYDCPLVKLPPNTVNGRPLHSARATTNNNAASRSD